MHDSQLILLCLNNKSRFLAGWPGLAYNESHETWLRRILFGVNFLVKLPPQVALDLATSIIQYSLTTTQLLQSVTPFFGEPNSYEYDRNMDRIGDVAAKSEARKMIEQSQVVEELPVMFDDEKQVSSMPIGTATKAVFPLSTDVTATASMEEIDVAVAVE